MCSKVSSEIETFEGASLGVGMTKPTADLVEDFSDDEEPSAGEERPNIWGALDEWKQ